jgi:hypothetical protein
MIQKLTKLYEYLADSHKTELASKVKGFLDEYAQTQELSEESKRYLKALCHPKGLGDVWLTGELYKRDFSDPSNPYAWMNFLSEISREIQ